MPLYAPVNVTRPVETTQNGTVWLNETPSVGDASARVALEQSRSGPSCFSVELLFASDPGAFQVDLQTSDTDAEANFVTKASLSSGLNASFGGRIEVVNVVARFARLKMVARTNSVAVLARIW